MLHRCNDNPRCTTRRWREAWSDGLGTLHQKLLHTGLGARASAAIASLAPIAAPGLWQEMDKRSTPSGWFPEYRQMCCEIVTNCGALENKKTAAQLRRGAGVPGTFGPAAQASAILCRAISRVIFCWSSSTSRSRSASTTSGLALATNFSLPSFDSMRSISD